MPLPPPKRYEEDADRIDDPETGYIGSDSTDEDEIRQDLRDAGFPDGAIDDIIDWLATSDDAWDLVEDSDVDPGRLADEIESSTGDVISDRRARSMASDIQSSIESAWDSVDAEIKDASGVDVPDAPDTAADRISRDIASQIQRGRQEIIQRLTSSGQTRDVNNQFAPGAETLRNDATEEIRPDGIYYVTDSKSYKMAEFDRGGQS